MGRKSLSTSTYCGDYQTVRFARCEAVAELAVIFFKRYVILMIRLLIPILWSNRDIILLGGGFAATRSKKWPELLAMILTKPQMIPRKKWGGDLPQHDLKSNGENFWL